MPKRVPLRVVVGEDQPLVREGVVHILERSGFDVSGVASDAHDLVRKAAAHKPDIVIADIQMPPDHSDDGLRAARTIRKQQPDVGILVLSQFLEDRYPAELIGDRAEGIGYLMKDKVADVAMFVDAVRRIAAGGSALDPEVVHRLVYPSRAKSHVTDLSPRESEVLSLMAEGLSNRGIADQLVVTVSAVERQVTGIFHKLELAPVPADHRRVLAVLRYLRG